MSNLKPLTLDTPWYRIESTDADWKAEDPVVLSRMLEQLLIIRQFEERILDLFKAGCVHGPAHASIGQEGGAVGAMSVLSSGDKINATHRAHHQFLAKFMGHVTPKGY
ncbi:MAG: MFS transporter, partial [Alphaproteobacteria bacterium]|nr:MFS transporter [Alphaproteobacteria bacterium]